MARFLRHKEAYGVVLDIVGGSDAQAFSLLLVLSFGLVMAGIRFGNVLLGIDPDPIVGRLSPMVPVLIPMAFVGELVYRMWFFAGGIGDFIPTLGRQMYLPWMENLAFGIPDFPVQILSAFFMLNGAVAACYILWRFCMEDFDGQVKLSNFIVLNLLISVFLLAYLAVIF